MFQRATFCVNVCNRLSPYVTKIFNKFFTKTELPCEKIYKIMCKDGNIIVQLLKSFGTNLNCFLHLILIFLI